MSFRAELKKLKTANPFLRTLRMAKMAFFVSETGVYSLTHTPNKGYRSLSWPDSGFHAGSTLSPTIGSTEADSTYMIYHLTKKAVPRSTAGKSQLQHGMYYTLFDIRIR